MAKQQLDTFNLLGKDLCTSIGFNPTSNSTKPLYVANSLFRTCTGIECKIDDVHGMKDLGKGRKKLRTAF